MSQPLQSKYVGHGVSNAVFNDNAAEDLLSSRSFYFAERYKSIDMALVENIDLERIQREVRHS